ncbi:MULTISPECIES: hypothetical protein [unclassified Lactobacillus]|uniref:hypothetical protein n=1 Tax=unclassified Lactobacillus TaxID=2620435 RepID=UPI0023F85C04|nr:MULTISPECIES: hypothetical protein [unclassified Lactobacillus]MDF7669262.1 hypothetical protein [Lactobacillus sp. ESL0703]WEV38745.1 hypothetical protein OZX58_00290 [Lactobacillus sp. ESL0680]
MKKTRKHAINLLDLIITIALLFLAIYQWKTNTFSSIVDIIIAIIFFFMASSLNNTHNHAPSTRQVKKETNEDIEGNESIAIAKQKTLKFIEILSLVVGIGLVILYYTVLKYPTIIIIAYVNLAYWSICQILPVILLLIHYAKK